MEPSCTARYIDHIGIAVRDLDAAMKLFQELFNVPTAEPQNIPDQKVRAVLLPIGQSRLELLEPLEADSSVGRFLENRGEGLHHLAFNVEDVGESLDALGRQGVRLVDLVPREGLSGIIGFIHPAAVHGVLTELVQSVEG